jgi:hypothetical protein
MTTDNAPRAATCEQRRPDLILGIIDNYTSSYSCGSAGITACVSAGVT